MTKSTFIGGGSTVFAKNLLGDILSFPELSDATISLMDIEPVRLQTSEIVAHKVAEFFQAKPTIEATLDRRRALDGADYAISMFQVGGYKPGTVIQAREVVGLGGDVTPYTMRHSAITKLAEATENVILIQKWAGHKDIATSAVCEGHPRGHGQAGCCPQKKLI